MSATPMHEPTSKSGDQSVAALGGVISFGAVLSAAACCVLPLALGAAGLGVGGLAAIVPFHWPLTIAAIIAVAAGWLFYARRRRACAADKECSVTRPNRATFATLCLATIFVTVSALWSLIEAPLMRLLGGA